MADGCDDPRQIDDLARLVDRGVAVAAASRYMPGGQQVGGPLLKGVLAIVVLFSTIFTFSEFNIIYVLTHGGPINSTHLFATLARQVGLETGRIGEGAAISLYLFPALMIVVWAQLRYVRKQVN